jgi:hypothetical protein
VENQANVEVDIRRDVDGEYRYRNRYLGHLMGR